MATTTAKTQKDVDEMTARERLYDSLSYSYGNKGDKIAEEFNKARSQADIAAQQRGMGRSSYNLQTLANIDKQKIDALNDNESAMIADYENRLADIENQEWQKDFQERQFQASRDDAAWNKEFQQGQFDWQKQQADRNFAYQQGRDEVADNQWNLNYEANRADTKWNQDFQREQYDWQKDFSQQQYADSRSDTNWQQAFSERQYEDSRSDTSWQQAFNEKQAEQQKAFNIISTAASLGNDVSDALLEQAGISRDDYNAMKTQAKTSGSGSPSGGGNWQTLGFNSKADYQAAVNGGFTSSTDYYAALKLGYTTNAEYQKHLNNNEPYGLTDGNGDTSVNFWSGVASGINWVKEASKTAYFPDIPSTQNDNGKVDGSAEFGGFYSTKTDNIRKKIQNVGNGKGIPIKTKD